MANNVNLTAIVIVALIIIGVVAGVYILNKGDTTTDKTVSATGNAEMKVDPDSVVVYFNIETRNLTAEDAKSLNSEITENVLNELDIIGVDEKDIQTENYNIYPEYDWSLGRQKLIGYVVSNSIKVTIRDFDNTGKVIDAGVDEGALVSYINFELSTEKMNEYKADVMAEASKDAKNKAEAIVSGLGRSIGDLVSVSASDYNYMPYPLFARAEGVSDNAQAKEAAVNIQPKQLDVTATVTVVYEIK